jgi:hypothetical protein
VLVAHRKVGLLPSLANATVTDVFYDADDLDIRFGVRPGPHTDARAERIASSEISFDKGFIDNDHALPALTHRQRIVFVEVSSSDNPGTEGRKEPGGDGIQVDIAIGGESFVALDCQGVVPGSADQQLEMRIAEVCVLLELRISS